MGIQRKINVSTISGKSGHSTFLKARIWTMSSSSVTQVSGRREQIQGRV